jgi:hypothetical protein
MNEKAIIADDGRLLCANPTCKNIELHYHIQHDRYDAYRIRYNAKTHEAYLVEDPMDGETLEVYDEYLHCPHCMAQHKMPLDENEQYPGIENISHEGDFLRKTRPDLPIYKCPRCSDTATAVVETFDTLRYINHGYENGVSIYDEPPEIMEDTGRDKHLYCCKCRLTWSAPYNTTIRTEKSPA